MRELNSYNPFQIWFRFEVWHEFSAKTTIKNKTLTTLRSQNMNRNRRRYSIFFLQENSDLYNMYFGCRSSSIINIQLVFNEKIPNCIDHRPRIFFFFWCHMTTLNFSRLTKKKPMCLRWCRRKAIPHSHPKHYVRDASLTIKHQAFISCKYLESTINFHI